MDILQDFRYYKVPPYSDSIFSKEIMITFFEKQFSNQQDDLESCDMDIDLTENDLEKGKQACDNQKVRYFASIYLDLIYIYLQILFL